MTKKYLIYNYNKVNKNRTFQDALDFICYNATKQELKLLLELVDFSIGLKKMLSPQNLNRQIKQGQARLKSGYYDQKA